MGHLEQMVNNFFPYSQKALNFDKPISIIFQSDEENASKMLGKTAYYDPEAMEVVLYTDNRHPKDILRSLSHELVHHAQNCRGDFHGGCDEEGGNNACVKDTGPGYAQRDPHLRKMEREAYTKGNLIFRDFEDLIKTGKINIEIDFSDSGEPKMSLNEWKNNELNTLLMKKWGLLKESTEDEEGAEELEEIMGFGSGREKAQRRIARGGTAARGRSMDKPAGHPDYKPDPTKGERDYSKPGVYAADDDEDELEEGWGWRDEDEAKKDESVDIEETRVDLARSRGQLHKTIDPETGEAPGMPGDDEPDSDIGLARAYGVGPKLGAKPGIGDRVEIPALKKNPTPEYSDTVVKPRVGSRSASLVRGAPRENQELPRKISVREAKALTRRIIERIRKEAK